MKGIVFTELLTMVESSYGFDMVDTIIENSDLPSGGAYTTVGTYSHSEIASLVTSLSKETNVDIPTLLKVFGTYLFHSLAKAYPDFVKESSDPLDFLEQVETYIHFEVRKLYPDADLPTFVCSRPNRNDELHMIYESNRHMEDACEGLIIGSLEHFGASFSLERKSLPDRRELFVISKNTF
tara:strand:+ start:15429 stop:15971 length:543 start_codon:yes stop_codon:yes gene_type:complete